MQEREKDIKRLLHIARAKVPVAFVDKGTMEHIKKVAKQNGNLLKELGSEEDVRILKEYAESPPVKTPPDVNGKRWSYYKVATLLNDYLSELQQKIRNNPKLENELQLLLGENIKEIRFSNYEIQYALSMKTIPERLRSLKVAMIWILLKIAVERGDIGKAGRGELVVNLANYYLPKLVHLEWKLLEKLLRDILLKDEDG